MDILFTLNGIFREVLDNPALTVTEATGAEDVDGWDSVAQVKLVLLTEMEFGIRFTTDQVAALKTVGDFVRTVALHL